MHRSPWPLPSKMTSCSWYVSRSMIAVTIWSSIGTVSYQNRSMLVVIASDLLSQLVSIKWKRGHVRCWHPS